MRSKPWTVIHGFWRKKKGGKGMRTLDDVPDAKGAFSLVDH